MIFVLEYLLQNASNFVQHQCIHVLWPSDVNIMLANGLTSVKCQATKPILTYHKLEPWEQASMRWQWWMIMFFKKIFLKMLSVNSGHFIQHHETWFLDSNMRVGVWSLPWHWHILSIPLTTGQGTSADTCGLDDVFPPDRAGVKYVLSNTNTNTNTFFSGVSNTNTNTNTPVKIWSNTNTNTAHQIQIQIHNEAETKLRPFYRWNIKIYCIVTEKMVLFIQVSLKIISKGPIYNKPTLVQIIAWRWVGNKPLSDQWWPGLLMHKCHQSPVISDDK